MDTNDFQNMVRDKMAKHDGHQLVVKGRSDDGTGLISECTFCADCEELVAIITIESPDSKEKFFTGSINPTLN